ncbi:SlyX family protein [Halotalea alkalilenta]|uniref:SlyX protein n=1 Tax=Halotalea alkalilenta TaxID=376489 RepID=A0A172YJW4_9GAMM|nr:SlyX family protein [Halotalea alkalilenta]ANF59500.1 hypothetical protein A5892_05155 [Halotalea alkalilenta]
MLDEHEARLEALETRLAFQEDWLETLDTRLIEQGRTLERLERINVLLQERLRQQSEGLDQGEREWRLEDDRPPHY